MEDTPRCVSSSVCGDAPPVIRRGADGTQTEEETRLHATEMVTTLRDAGAKLVCIDFDATFVSIHTGGTWTRSAVELTQHVRGLFLVLVPMLMDAGIHVAVVTFSPQLELIRDVVRQCLGDDIARKVLVRCDDASWTLAMTETLNFVPKWQLCGMHVDRRYKLPYVISAANQASEERGELICNRDTILIDDDAKNIRIANDNGITGIYFEPDGVDAKELSRRIKKLHAPPQSPTPIPLGLQTPSKRKTARVVATPEMVPRHTRTPPAVRVTNTPVVASISRKKKFSLCTPSPVMTLKYTVDMGRPKSKRATRLRRRPRSIEDDLHGLRHIPASASAGENDSVQSELVGAVGGRPPTVKSTAHEGDATVGIEIDRAKASAL